MIPAPTKAKDTVRWLGREDSVVGTIKDLEGVRGQDGAIYSCWKPSLRERFHLLFGQPVIVGVLSDRQPPLCVKVGRENIALAPGSTAPTYTLLEFVLGKVKP